MTPEELEAKLLELETRYLKWSDIANGWLQSNQERIEKLEQLLEMELARGTMNQECGEAAQAD
jgi:hypothetical protein